MNEQLMAIIPHIPAILQSGKSVWELMIKPILKQIGYNIPKELEQEMIEKENNKDLIGIINSIEEFAKSIQPNVNNQNYIGDNGNNFQNINGNIYQNNFIQTQDKKLTNLSEKAKLILKELYENEQNILTIYQSDGGLFSVNANHTELGSIDKNETIIIKNAIIELKNNNFIHLIKQGKSELSGRYEMTNDGLNYIKNNPNIILGV